MHSGGCLCGAVRYEISGELAPIQVCHCSQCRKAQGGPFATNIPVPRSAFRLTKGEGETTSYFFNQHKIDHRFCKTCGVQPFGYGVGPDGAEVAAINIRTLTDIEPWTWTAQRVDGRSF